MQVVLIADRFPALGDPLVELARALGHVRVEAAERPRELDVAALRELPVAYREDDGAAQRLAAVLALGARHPTRVAARPERARTRRAAAPRARARRAPPDRAIRPAACLPLGAGSARASAHRIARLAGRPLRDAAPASASVARRRAQRARA